MRELVCYHDDCLLQTNAATYWLVLVGNNAAYVAGTYRGDEPTGLGMVPNLKDDQAKWLDLSAWVEYAGGFRVCCPLTILRAERSTPFSQWPRVAGGYCSEILPVVAQGVVTTHGLAVLIETKHLTLDPTPVDTVLKVRGMYERL